MKKFKQLEKLQGVNLESETIVNPDGHKERFEDIPTSKPFVMQGYCLGSNSAEHTISEGANAKFDLFSSKGTDEKESPLFTQIKQAGDTYYEEIELKAGYWYELESRIGIYSEDGYSAEVYFEWKNEDGVLDGSQVGVSSVDCHGTPKAISLTPAWAIFPAHTNTKVKVTYREVIPEASSGYLVKTFGTKTFKIKAIGRI